MTVDDPRSSASGAPRRGTSRHGDRGQAGVEVVAFGVLVFVAGALLVTNVWAVIDAKFAADGAAREATRTVVERAGVAITDDELVADARRVAVTALGRQATSRPIDVAVSTSTGDFTRCARVSVTVSFEVPAIRLPFGGGFGHGVDVAATHSELVDPSRAGGRGSAVCIR